MSEDVYQTQTVIDSRLLSKKLYRQWLRKLAPFRALKSSSDVNWPNQFIWHSIILSNMPISNYFAFDIEIPSPWNGHGDPDYMSIRGWFTKLNNVYQSKHHLEMSQITALDWFKTDDGLRHEYVVATLERPGVPKAFLRIERAVSSRLVSDDDQMMINELSQSERTVLMNDIACAKGGSCKQGFWSSLQSTTGSIKPAKCATDTVIQVPSRFGHVQVDPRSPCPKIRRVATYRDFKSPLSLRDFVFLAKAIHEHQTRYLFFVNQCYWFAYVLMEIVKERYDPTVLCGRAYNRAGHYRRFVPVVSKHRTAMEIDMIQALFIRLVRQSDNMIQMAEVETMRAEAAEREAEAARQQAQIEKRKVELLERELEDARRVIENVWALVNNTNG